MTQVEKIKSTVGKIIESNARDDDLQWVSLAQALDFERTKTPIIRNEELQDMVSQAINSPRLKFRELVYSQLAQQMKIKGSKEYIVRKKQKHLNFLLIINAQKS